MPMTSTLSRTRSDVSTRLWGAEPSMDEPPFRAANDQFPSKRPSLQKGASRVLARFLITFCIGVAATLVWQSYGGAAREMIASSSPQLSWLAPQGAPFAQTRPEKMVAPALAAPSSDQQQLNAITLMQQSIDQLAAGQQQMTREITKLRAAEQEILDKISVPPPRPAAAPAHKPLPRRHRRRRSRCADAGNGNAHGSTINSATRTKTPIAPASASLSQVADTSSTRTPVWADISALPCEMP